MALGVVLKALGVLLECSWSVYKGASRLEERSTRAQGELRGRSGRARGGVGEGFSTLSPWAKGVKGMKGMKD